MLRQQRSWVTKTDVARFVRCPYAFWLLDRGLITFEETLNEFQAQLLRAGTEFEALVTSSAVPVELVADGIRGLLGSDMLVLGTPDIRNRKLRIHGRPDGIDMAEGALYPIEVKSHRRVTRLDELELAFYWLLLEPLRKRRDVPPRGLVILRLDGQPEVVEVPIAADRLEEVRRLIRAVREARRLGVQPRVCGCQVCSVTRRDEVRRMAGERHDLTMIFGIGPAYAAALEAAGIGTWDELLDHKPAGVADVLRAAGYRAVSEREAACWRQHARSYQAGAPVLFGLTRPFPAWESFIALDLEYGIHIWLTGACVVTADTRRYLSWWADDLAAEQDNLDALGRLVRDHPGLPILTWAGNSADIPRLRAAAMMSLRAEATLEELFRRHSDVFVFARSHLRLPVPGLGLKEVSDYFGIPRIAQVTDGFQAQMLYTQYQRTRDPALRELLTDYNREDLDGLIDVVDRLRSLTVTAPAPAAL